MPGHLDLYQSLAEATNPDAPKFGLMSEHLAYCVFCAAQQAYLQTRGRRATPCAGGFCVERCGIISEELAAVGIASDLLRIITKHHEHWLVRAHGGDGQHFFVDASIRDGEIWYPRWQDLGALGSFGGFKKWDREKALAAGLIKVWQ